MPNYLVNHTLLGPGPTGNKDAVPFADSERKKFVPGQIVTEKMLTDAGFDIERLKARKAGGFSAAIIAQAEPGQSVSAPASPPAPPADVEP